MKPQDRNVNSVCLSSQEPVALSTFWCVLRLIGGYFMSANVNASEAVNVATLWHQTYFPRRGILTFFVGLQLITSYSVQSNILQITISFILRRRHGCHRPIAQRGTTSVYAEWLHLQVICVKHLVQSAFPHILRKHISRFPFDVNNTLLKWVLQRPLRNTRYVWISRQIWRGYV